MTNARRLILLGGVILFAAGVIGLLVPVTISGGIGCGNAVHSDLSAAREQDNRNVGNSQSFNRSLLPTNSRPKASSSRPATRLWVIGACGRFRWPWSDWPALAGPLRSVEKIPARAFEPSALQWPSRAWRREATGGGQLGWITRPATTPRPSRERMSTRRFGPLLQAFLSAVMPSELSRQPWNPVRMV